MIFRKVHYCTNTSVQNVLFWKWIRKYHPLSFQRWKESLAKKNRPLVKNCRKFFRNGSKNHNSSRVPISSGLVRQTSDFCLRHCSEFLIGNSSHAGFLKTKYKVLFDTNYIYNHQFKIIFGHDCFDLCFLSWS